MADAIDIAGLTDSAAVIASTGLSTRGDVRHETVVEMDLESDLLLALAVKVPTYERITAEGLEPTATPEQQLRLRALKNYAKWLCAVIFVSRWLSIMQLKSDGKTRADRFDRMDLSRMQENIVAQRGKALATLYRLIPAEDRPATRTSIPLGLSLPSSDPVTDIDSGA